MFSLRSLRIKAMQQLFAFFIQRKAAEKIAGDVTFSAIDKRFMVQNVGENIKIIHALHSSFLQLMTSWAEIEHKRAMRLIEKPSTPLYDDPFLTALRKDSRFQEICEAHPTRFAPVDIERWYDSYKDTKASFQEEEANISPSESTLLVHSLVKHMFKSKEIQRKAAQEDIYWEEDRGLVYQRLRRFISDFAQKPSDSFALYSSALSAEKEDFYHQLIAKTVALQKEHDTLLRDNVPNWSLERINVLDQTLIRMALTEIMIFSHIPKKVSINEYLEIAKQYSTPKSAAFINGVVDQITKENISS